MDSQLRLILIESRIHRLTRYYRTNMPTPLDPESDVLVAGWVVVRVGECFHQLGYSKRKRRFLLLCIHQLRASILFPIDLLSRPSDPIQRREA